MYKLYPLRLQQLIIFLFAFSFAKNGLGQAPSISYGVPKTFAVGAAISPIAPNNTGGVVPATIPGAIANTFPLWNTGTYPTGFSTIVGVTIDNAGNLYVSDQGNNKISEISPSGIVTAIAGSGSVGAANGPGPLASFNSPSGMVRDGSGNLFVCDAGNNLIRKITPAGAVSTFAGSGVAGLVNGNANTARFNDPEGITIDGYGNLYVTDRGNNVVRIISKSGFVGTFAGSGAQGSSNGTGIAATFSGVLQGITIDGSGNLYVTDNNLIRKISPLKVVSTFAGGGNLNGGDGDGVGTAANFTSTYSLTFDQLGNLYVAELPGSIRKITPAAVVSTLGPFQNSLFYFGIVANSSGNLEVSRGYGISTCFTTGYAINPDLPSGLNFDGATGTISGTPLAVSPATNYTITAYNSAGSGTAIISIATLLQAPPNTPLFAPNTATVGATVTIKGTGFTGASSVSFGGTAATSFAVISDSVMTATVGTGASGNVNITTTAGLISLPGFVYNTPPKISYPGFHAYVAGTAITPIMPTNVGGNVPALSPYPGVTLFKKDVADLGLGIITSDRAGNLYLAARNNNSGGNNEVLKITPAGTVITLAGGGTLGFANGIGTVAKFNGISGIAADIFGNVYVSDYANNLIRKVNSIGVVTTFAGNGAKISKDGTAVAASFKGPASITIDGAGNLYVVDGGNVIRKITPDGVVSTLAGSGTTGSTNGIGTAASFVGIDAITADGSGNIYVADGTYNTSGGSYVIRKISPAGLVSIFAGNGAAGETDGTGTSASFRYPSSLTSDGFGNIYVLSKVSSTIRLITQSAEVSTLHTNSLNITGITSDGFGNLFATYQTDVIKATLGGYSIMYGNSTGGQVLPAGLTFDDKTGTVNGNPTVPRAATTYTVTAYNSAGSSTTALNIAVKEKVAQSISFSEFRTATLGDADIDPVAHSNSGLPLTFTSSDPSVASILNGKIHLITTGTVVITASQPGNDIYSPAISLAKNLTIVLPPAPNITFKGATTLNYGINKNIAPIQFLNSGSPVPTNFIGPSSPTGFIVSPTLPAGLVFDLTTLSITGTPTVASPATNYVITGKTNYFSSSATVNITVTGPPAISYNGPKTYTVGTAIAPLTLTSSGVAALAYSSILTSLGSGFTTPYGTAVDSAGNVYVADCKANTVSKIPAAGGPAVVIGTGFLNPSGVAVDAAGNVYVTDAGNNVVKKIPAGGGAPVVICTSLNDPIGIALDAAANIYVSNYGANTIVKIPAGGGSPAIIGTGFNRPMGLAVDAAGNVYVANSQTSSIEKIPASRGAPIFMTDYFYFPTGVAVDNAGNVFVADYGNKSVSVLKPSKGTEPWVPIILNSGLNYPFGLAMDGAGNMYIGNTGAKSVIKINPLGGFFISPALPLGLSFDRTTGNITGKPTVGSPATDYMVTAYNLGGGTVAKVNITVLSSNAKLSNIVVSSGTLSPVFDPLTLNYTAIVANSVSTVLLTPISVNSNAVIKVNGSIVVSGTASASIPLVVGSNVITTVVTAEDGKTQNKYKVTVTRAVGSLNSLILPGQTGETTLLLTTPGNEKVIANNILSPNGDGVNDLWIVKNIAFYPNNKVTVYNAAGNVVFTKKNYANNWAGTYNGSVLDQGTYYYLVELGNGKTMRGFITVVKDK